MNQLSDYIHAVDVARPYGFVVSLCVCVCVCHTTIVLETLINIINNK